MRITGPLLTLAAVAAVGAGVATANVVLTAQPAQPAEPAAVEQATGALALGSPLPEAAPAGPVLYSGWSADREVSVDITVEDGLARAYVCDDASVESWTRGPVAQDGPTRLTADDGSWVEYTVQDGTATGTASTGGRTWEFTAPTAPAGTEPPAGAPAAPAAPAAPEAGGGYGGGGY
ncbi:hypothetical protein GCM10009613_31380 [Pseudonocardia kongjuensis]|uniref:Uncharacterized protein n=1 Tax=Pseudonocardia kongjuensis TaxID=102227 RepID=A0ABP4IMY4_9PSEU